MNNASAAPTTTPAVTPTVTPTVTPSALRHRRQNRRLARLWERLLHESRDHVVTRLHEVSTDHGSYRHFRFHTPGHNRWSWEIITSPGRLTVTGEDTGTYLFHHPAHPDTVTLFRNLGGLVSAIDTPDALRHYVDSLDQHLLAVDPDHPVSVFSSTGLKTHVAGQVAEHFMEEAPELVLHNLEDHVLRDLHPSAAFQVHRNVKDHVDSLHDPRTGLVTAPFTYQDLLVHLIRELTTVPADQYRADGLLAAHGPATTAKLWLRPLTELHHRLESLRALVAGIENLDDAHQQLPWFYQEAGLDPEKIDITTATEYSDHYLTGCLAITHGVFLLDPHDTSGTDSVGGTDSAAGTGSTSSSAGTPGNQEESAAEEEGESKP